MAPRPRRNSPGSSTAFRVTCSGWCVGKGDRTGGHRTPWPIICTWREKRTMIEPMRGWQITRTGAPGDVLHLADLPVPEPGPGQLTVDVEYAGLSYADHLLIRGEYQVALPLPCVPGSEFVGRVLEAGPGTSLSVGTRVMGLCLPPHGTYAEQCVAREIQCEPIPEDL